MNLKVCQLHLLVITFAKKRFKFMNKEIALKLLQTPFTSNAQFHRIYRLFVEYVKGLFWRLEPSVNIVRFQHFIKVRV